MFDVDKFIEHVQMHPAIWKMGSQEYINRGQKERSWNSIGKVMFSAWAEQTNSEREEQVKLMKVKWRHIRDSYSKFINQGKSGDPAKKKKYIYTDALNFLLDTVQKRREDLNNPSPQEEQTTSGDEESTSVGSNIQERPSNSDEPRLALSAEPRARKSQGVTNFQSLSFKPDPSNRTRQNAMCGPSQRIKENESLRQKDEFDSFGESVAAQLRSLKNPRARSLAKFNIQKALFEAESQDIESQITMT